MIRRIGPHVVTNASIDDPIVDRMLAGSRIHVLYSDPPWGDGNLRYWATMNRKMTGQDVAPLTYERLLGRLEELIGRYVDGHVFIETGPRWVDPTIAALPLRNIATWPLRYRSGSRWLENILIHGTTHPAHEYDGPDPTGWHGAAVARGVIAAVATPGKLVLDPCCGMGYTARAAVAAGMVFRGNELNAKRLQKTIAFLEAYAGAGVP